MLKIIAPVKDLMVVAVEYWRCLSVDVGSGGSGESGGEYDAWQNVLLLKSKRK